MANKPFFRRRKVCPFSGENAPKIDYKDTRLLQRYVSERGKIVPSRITAVSASSTRIRLAPTISPARVPMMSTIGFRPETAAPIPRPTMACSAMGVSTRAMPRAERNRRMKSRRMKTIRRASSRTPTNPTGHGLRRLHTPPVHR